MEEEIINEKYGNFNTNGLKLLVEENAVAKKIKNRFNVKMKWCLILNWVFFLIVSLPIYHKIFGKHLIKSFDTIVVKDFYGYILIYVLIMAIPCFALFELGFFDIISSKLENKIKLKLNYERVDNLIHANKTFLNEVEIVIKLLLQSLQNNILVQRANSDNLLVDRYNELLITYNKINEIGITNFNLSQSNREHIDFLISKPSDLEASTYKNFLDGFKKVNPMFRPAFIDIYRRRVAHTRASSTKEAYYQIIIQNQARQVLEKFMLNASDNLKAIFMFDFNSFAKNVEDLELLYQKNCYTGTNTKNVYSKTINPISNIVYSPKAPDAIEIKPPAPDPESSTPKISTREPEFKPIIKKPILVPLYSNPQSIISQNLPKQPIIRKRRIISTNKLKELIGKRNIIGLLGEEFIYKSELSKFDKKQLMMLPIIHASKELGDGLGYDIQSVDKNYNSIFIEVKTTVKNENESFYISKNEYEKFIEGSNHYIYRVVNFNIEERQGDIIMIKSMEELKNDYIVNPKIYTVRMK